MEENLTLKHVEELAEKLLPHEQLRLIAFISERLSQFPYNNQNNGYAEYIDSLLEACDKVAEQIDGDFDSAEDLRQIRREKDMSIFDEIRKLNKGTDPEELEKDIQEAIQAIRSNH